MCKRMWLSSFVSAIISLKIYLISQIKISLDAYYENAWSAVDLSFQNTAASNQDHQHLLNVFIRQYKIIIGRLSKLQYHK